MILMRSYLVDDVDGTLQHESGSLPLVIDAAAVLSQLLDLVLGCLAEQHLETAQEGTTEAFTPKRSKMFERVATYSSVAICLKVNANVKLQSCVMKMLHSCLSASYRYLGDRNDFKNDFTSALKPDGI